MIKLKDLLLCLDKNMCVEIIIDCISDGVYLVEELLDKDSSVLENMVSLNGIGIYVEQADGLIANDSTIRNNEFYKEDEEIIYMGIYVDSERR